MRRAESPPVLGVAVESKLRSRLGPRSLAKGRSDAGCGGDGIGGNPLANTLRGGIGSKPPSRSTVQHEGVSPGNVAGSRVIVVECSTVGHVLRGELGAMATPKLINLCTTLATQALDSPHSPTESKGRPAVAREISGSVVQIAVGPLEHGVAPLPGSVGGRFREQLQRKVYGNRASTWTTAGLWFEQLIGAAVLDAERIMASMGKDSSVFRFREGMILVSQSGSTGQCPHFDLTDGSYQFIVALSGDAEPTRVLSTRNPLRNTPTVRSHSDVDNCDSIVVKCSAATPGQKGHDKSEKRAVRQLYPIESFVLIQFKDQVYRGQVVDFNKTDFAVPKIQVYFDSDGETMWFNEDDLYITSCVTSNCASGASGDVVSGNSCADGSDAKCDPRNKSEICAATATGVNTPVTETAKQRYPTTSRVLVQFERQAYRGKVVGYDSNIFCSPKIQVKFDSDGETMWFDEDDPYVTCCGRNHGRESSGGGDGGKQTQEIPAVTASELEIPAVTTAVEHVVYGQISPEMALHRLGITTPYSALKGPERLLIDVYGDLALPFTTLNKRMVPLAACDKTERIASKTRRLWPAGTVTGMDHTVIHAGPPTEDVRVVLFFVASPRKSTSRGVDDPAQYDADFTTFPFTFPLNFDGCLDNRSTLKLCKEYRKFKPWEHIFPGNEKAAAIVRDYAKGSTKLNLALTAIDECTVDEDEGAVMCLTQQLKSDSPHEPEAVTTSLRGRVHDLTPVTVMPRMLPRSAVSSAGATAGIVAGASDKRPTKRQRPAKRQRVHQPHTRSVSRLVDGAANSAL
jgi:hypothetical protein